MKSDKTSWGNVAEWYDDHLENERGTYQAEVILPNLLRLLALKKDETVLDLACGQGFFSREFHKAGANVIGVDIARELIAIAKVKSSQEIFYVATPADDLSAIPDNTADKIVIVMAIQNIENLAGVLKESNRVLKPFGRLFIVLNHPTFRIPKASEWGWDDTGKKQYRRIDRYMSEIREKIEMNPGSHANKRFTVSFHRPLQAYFKALQKANFSVMRLEEWISHRKSQKGPRAFAEDLARKEIPMFMCLDARKTH